MAAPITSEQIALVKATVPVLQQQGEAITTAFYNNLLAANPDLRNIFSASAQANGRQPKALAGAVLAYATYIDNLPVLAAAVERIAHKHVSLGVQPEHYPIVGKFLLEAIVEVLGPEVATTDILDAWAAAYGELANIFIGAEKSMYAENGEWQGWRKFRVERRVPESESIESFYLSPVDGSKQLPSYRPGQFVTLRIKLPELGGIYQSRHYSLSEAPRHPAVDGYRISVKREDGAADGGPAGMVSNALHKDYVVGTEVELSHPQGVFCLTSDKTKENVPVVLISAGVGATPLMAMLETLTSPQTAVRRPVSWIHTSHSARTIPFTEPVRRICRDNEHVSAHVFLSSAGPEESAADYQLLPMRLNLANLDCDRDLFINNTSTEYFICGPETFMADMRRSLVDMGVDKQRISLELFAQGSVEE
jgi:nitric oxide dioxygenase